MKPAQTLADIGRCFAVVAGILLSSTCWADPPATQPAVATASVASGAGERVPSEDPVLKDFHSLGLIDGHTNIFRCACPVRDLAKRMATTQPTDEQLAEAESRMRRLYDLGVRTVISFQDPAVAASDAGEGKVGDVAAACALERAAAKKVGLIYVSRPMANSGPNSLETMSDRAVMNWADAVTAEIFKDADKGGVVFHCSAGHDRTGLVAAYIRLKYQHWPVDQAIDEMRRFGHNWPKYSNNGGVSSWHEEHLRAIANLLDQQQEMK